MAKPLLWAKGNHILSIMAPKSISSAEVGVWMIHGNLQTPKVWQPIATQLQQAIHPSLSIFLEDVWTSPEVSLEEWARLFCQRVQTQSLKSRFLLGYSLGGRLGFHALIHQPELWRGAIIISADPGVRSDCDRNTSLERDQQWSHKVLHEPWDTLLQAWNALPVFCGRQPTYPVLESDFSRHKLAETFQTYSKGHQAHLLSPLQQLSLPILYLSGEEDRQYGQIGQTLAEHCPTLTHQIIPQAGHRVLWDNPQASILALTQFFHQHQ